MFICMFVLSHLCLTGFQGIRWSWSWKGSRRLQSLCPASLGRRTSTWDRTFLEAKRFCPLFTVYKITLYIWGSLFIVTLRWPPHLLDTSPGWEWGSRTCSVVPENQTSIELFFFSNFTVFPYKSLKMHQSQVGVKKYLRRWTTSSTKIQVWTTFCLHPNLCKSISKLDHNLVFQSLSAQHTIHVHNVYWPRVSRYPILKPRLLTGSC